MFALRWNNYEFLIFESKVIAFLRLIIQKTVRRSQSTRKLQNSNPIKANNQKEVRVKKSTLFDAFFSNNAKKIEKELCGHQKRSEEQLSLILRFPSPFFSLCLRQLRGKSAPNSATPPSRYFAIYKFIYTMVKEGLPAWEYIYKKKRRKVLIRIGRFLFSTRTTRVI